MRRNPTLPTIRDSTQGSSNKNKEGVESYRKIEDKINSHDEEIVKNEKIISTLANEFRMLKEQLQFQQEYNEKYKSSMTKYQEDTAKHLKMIRDQKQTISKLEHILKEKQKQIDVMNKERLVWKEKMEELNSTLEEIQRESKRKDGTIKQMETLLDKAKKEVKQKDAQIKAKEQVIKHKENQFRETIKQKENELREIIKQKENELREAFVTDRQLRQTKIKKLEKDLQLANVLMENTKEIISAKDKEIYRLGVELFQSQEKLKSLDKTQYKSKTMVEEVRLVQRQNEDLRKKLKDTEEQVKNLDVMLKTQESKANTSTNEKVKQLQQQKKELSQKADKLGKQMEEFKRKMDSQRKDREKAEKKEQEARERLAKLQAFSEKLSKSKTEINQQLTKLRSNILCDYCSKPMKNPVTNIPCGHSYCQDCKAGYLKQCKKCNGVKRQAVYRNELLDEIIQASNLIERMIILMNN